MRIITFIAFILVSGCTSPDPEIITLSISKKTIPKGIAVDPINKDIYVSSMHEDRIVHVDSKGQFKNTVLDRIDDGYSIGAGMDFFGNNLYALATFDRDTFSMLYIKNNATGRKFSFRVENTATNFNDLAIDKNGNAYITDTDHHTIYYYDHETKNISKFLFHEDIKYPNGIALSSDQSKLFVDSYSHGIRIIDIEQKSILNNLHSPTAEWGVDGIKYHDGKLYFIVNGIKDKSQHGLYSLDLIDNEMNFGNLDPVMVFHDKMKIPTTLSIVENSIYILANSQLDLLDQKNNSIIDSNKITRTYILKKKIPE